MLTSPWCLPPCSSPAPSKPAALTHCPDTLCSRSFTSVPAHCQTHLCLFPLSSLSPQHQLPLSKLALSPLLPSANGAAVRGGGGGLRQSISILSFYSHHFPHTNQLSEGTSSCFLVPTCIRVAQTLNTPSPPHLPSTPPQNPAWPWGSLKPGQDQQGPGPSAEPTFCTSHPKAALTFLTVTLVPSYRVWHCYSHLFALLPRPHPRALPGHAPQQHCTRPLPKHPHLPLQPP